MGRYSKWDSVEEECLHLSKYRCHLFYWVQCIVLCFFLVPDYELFPGSGKCTGKKSVYQGMTQYTERCAQSCRQAQFSYFIHDGCESIKTNYMSFKVQFCNCYCLTDVVECNQTSSLAGRKLHKFFGKIYSKGCFKSFILCVFYVCA